MVLTQNKTKKERTESVCEKNRIPIMNEIVIASCLKKDYKIR